jgi:DNA modification methylase
MTEEIRQGDVLARLREMPDRSVQCVVTSPPYYGLRDYGTDVWEGGDPDCDHQRNKTPGAGSFAGGQAITEERGKEGYRDVCNRCGARRVSPWIGGDPGCDHMHKVGGTAASTLGAGSGGNDMSDEARLQSTERSFVAYAGTCGKCGAVRAGRWTGGDPECDHSQARARLIGNAPSLKSTLRGTGPRPGEKFSADQGRKVASDCPACGARWTTSQLGLEPTPDEYVDRLVEIFREIRRVLRDDGVAWLNLGDSYSTQPKGNPGALSTGLTNSGRNAAEANAHRGSVDTSKLPGVKPKDLLGIPWMVAFALRADGWFLRSDVIWAKPNPMPESVTDRPTSAHEHVFLLTKSRSYFYDAEAIREKAKDWSRGGPGTGIANTAERYGAGNGGNAGLSALAARYKRATWEERRAAGATRGNVAFDGNVGAGTQRGVHGKGVSHDLGSAMGRNKRNVWEIATQPYAEAHFATFPTKLVEPCILAGSSPKACGQCGAPWRRVIERGTTGEVQANGSLHLKPSSRADVTGKATGDSSVFRTGVWTAARTTGWEPTCNHDDWGLDLSRPQARRAQQLAVRHGLTDEHVAAIRACGITDVGKAQVTQDGYGKNDPRAQALADEAKAALGGYYREFMVRPRNVGREPSCGHHDDSGRCLVLDPFAGSGTVGVVARWHGRDFIGIELNAEYCEMARRRILREGNPGRRAATTAAPIPGQMTMDFD